MSIGNMGMIGEEIKEIIDDTSKENTYKVAAILAKLKLAIEIFKSCNVETNMESIHLQISAMKNLFREGE